MMLPETESVKAAIQFVPSFPVQGIAPRSLAAMVRRLLLLKENSWFA